MIYYKIINQDNKNNIYINNKLIGHYLHEENGIKFYSEDEDIIIVFNEEIFKNILISRIHTFDEYLKYKNNPSWSNLYKLLIYTILYLDYLRNNDDTNNNHEKQLVHNIFKVH
jgi:hypothetical protein